jgi:DNA-directed RNA polymerase specialized sigma24 family protein
MADQDCPEWQAVLTQVLVFATKHALYPDDIDATSWPDLDAYQDIQIKLPTYNFEGSLDSWVTVTILNRLRRFWRDRQALSAGGPGFKYKTGAAAAPAPADQSLAPKLYQFSLDQIADDEWLIAESHSADQFSVGSRVEDAELQRIVAEAVHDFALQKHDIQFQQIWHAVVERQLKLREASLYFGLTISQVHRRLEQVRAHLRQDPRVAHWFNAGE